jgi:hypothetical protein
MSKNRGKSKLSKNVLFNANKHVFHCEKSLATLFYGQPSYNFYDAEICVLWMGSTLINEIQGFDFFNTEFSIQLCEVILKHFDGHPRICISFIFCAQSLDILHAT